MQAAVVIGSESVEVRELPVPEPAVGEARVRVRAAALTRGEDTWPEGRYPSIVSYEIAGTVDAVGADVTGVSIGDEVYALLPFDRDGGAAELAIVPAATLAPRPRTLGPAAAAALPLAGLSAWQALFDHGSLREGQRVMVTGAGGGVGHLAVQLATWAHAEVVAVGETDEVDLVFDTAGPESWRGVRAERVVTIVDEEPGATYFLVHADRDQLTELARLADEGLLVPEVDSTFPMERVGEAFERLAVRHKHGKVVLDVAGGR
jgi:NADPH:quinone reductase-like Zn-dependent oxidoreductase